MATVAPFRGIRFNPEKVKSLADVVTPPYDVIDPAAQDRYYRRHPNNIIRLEYGKVLEGDGPGSSRYTRAASDYTAWLEEKVLAPENEPAFYLYEQEFTAGGSKRVRTGFFCAVKLEPYEKGVVLPHEETLPKHKADRLELMRACRANFSPIFSLYADQEMAVTGALREAAGHRAPDAACTDEGGEIHRLWVISDQSAVNTVRKIMNEKRIFIADGHHRYETALNYRAERLAGGGGSGAFNYVMMALVNLYDPGLVVLPTHRLVRNAAGNDVSSLIKRIQEDFSLEEFPLSPGMDNFNEFLDLMARRGAGSAGDLRHRHVFGVYTGGGRLFTASLKDEDQLAKLMPGGKSPAWQGLDVSVLHSLIIEKYLGIGQELLARGEHITYTREEVGALRAVDSGDYQVALFLNPTLVEEVTEVAANGEKMPQKSTYFYPKIITGLMINSLE